MNAEAFKYRITCGWLRDLASQPTPDDPWPCIRWDDQVFHDQLHFFDVQAEMGVTHHLAWGLFINNAWPVPFENVVSDERARRVKSLTAAAHQRGLKVIHGTGIYSWGFEQVIEKVPGVSAGHTKAMCPFQPAAWDWQRRVLDFIMDEQWGIDGLSMQSADQGRCECDRCKQVSTAEHHANILVRCAEYVRSQRPDWLIGQAAWGLKLHEPTELPHIQRMSKALDYMIEVSEKSRGAGRPEIISSLSCAFGSVGGVFMEPPQHWDRLRWFVPCGLSSARRLRELHADGGRACEYYFRTFENPVEEVSWRTGANILGSPATAPEAALEQAVARVYGVAGVDAGLLADWFARSENAYFSRSSYKVGDGPLSLEPLVWKDNPAAAGPAIYLRDRMTEDARADYGRELQSLKQELAAMKLANGEAVRKTLTAIDGTLGDIARL